MGCIEIANGMTFIRRRNAGEEVRASRSLQFISSPDHGDISVNVVGLLFGQLRGKPCRVRTKDTKVRSGPMLSSGQTVRGLFSYPDILVVCGGINGVDPATGKVPGALETQCTLMFGHMREIVEKAGGK